MGKGGDSTTSTTTSDLGTFSQPYFEDVIKRGQTLSNQGYTPYNGQRLANFSTDTNNSFQAIRDQAARGTGGLDVAQGVAADVGNFTAGGIGSTTVGTGGTFDPRSITDAGFDMSAYMNPYTTNVMDVAKDAATRRYQEQQIARDNAAISAGAFGGDRRFVTDSLAMRDTNEQLNALNSEMLNSAYDKGLGAFQNEERLRFDAYTGDSNRTAQVGTANADRGLQAAIANEEARRLGGALRLDAANSSADMSQQSQDMGFRNAEALSSVGAKIQQRDQAGLDIAYGDFQKQQTDQRDKLSWYAALLAGQPVKPNTTTTEAESAPDFLSQLLGLGTAAFGLGGLG